MLHNYWKMAIRVLKRNRFFSILTISGLALGITCSLLIGLWVDDERSFDAFHLNKATLFNVYEREFGDGKITADYETPAVLGVQLKKEVPEVLYAVNTDWDDPYTFRVEGKTIAFIIAAPIARWLMFEWLEEYAYHTDLSAPIFLTAGLLAILIALATISYHSIKTSLANPVKNLRSE